MKPVSFEGASEAADSKFAGMETKIMMNLQTGWSTPLVAMLEAGIIRTEPRGVISR